MSRKRVTHDRTMGVRFAKLLFDKKQYLLMSCQAVPTMILEVHRTNCTIKLGTVSNDVSTCHLVVHQEFVSVCVSVHTSANERSWKSSELHSDTLTWVNFGWQRQHIGVSRRQILLHVCQREVSSSLCSLQPFRRWCAVLQLVTNCYIICWSITHWLGVKILILPRS